MISFLRSSIMSWCFLFAGMTIDVTGFVSSSQKGGRSYRPPTIALWSSPSPETNNSNDEWKGDVVSNIGGKIRGCSIVAVGEEPITKWEMTIDGVDADLGPFSAAIYKKIVTDAKQQRFQGFRPGTIPPHLEGTYRAFSMDECARETVLEAMEQNSIRPFSTAREDVLIEQISIPPPQKSQKGKKKKSNKKKNKKGMGMGMEASSGDAAKEDTAIDVEAAVEAQPQWKTFESMKEAINAGWKPGQSFSFVATNVRGQKVLTNDDIQGTPRPLGARY